jgi:hypothetical protein
MAGSVPFLIGVALGIRFIVQFARGEGDGHVQSLILAAVLLLMGFLTFLMAVLAVGEGASGTCPVRRAV